MRTPERNAWCGHRRWHDRVARHRGLSLMRCSPPWGDAAVGAVPGTDGDATCLSAHCSAPADADGKAAGGVLLPDSRTIMATQSAPSMARSSSAAPSSDGSSTTAPTRSPAPSRGDDPGAHALCTADRRVERWTRRPPPPLRRPPPAEPTAATQVQEAPKARRSELNAPPNAPRRPGPDVATASPRRARRVDTAMTWLRLPASRGQARRRGSQQRGAQRRRRAEELQERKQQKAEKQQQQQQQQSAELPGDRQTRGSGDASRSGLARILLHHGCSPTVLRAVQPHHINAQRATCAGQAHGPGTAGAFNGKGASAASVGARTARLQLPRQRQRRTKTSSIYLVAQLEGSCRLGTHVRVGARTHSLKDIKEWEKRAGKMATLSHAERWEANKEINDILRGSSGCYIAPRAFEGCARRRLRCSAPSFTQLCDWALDAIKPPRH